VLNPHRVANEKHEREENEMGAMIGLLSKYHFAEGMV
jgi:hypothetical protein